MTNEFASELRCAKRGLEMDHVIDIAVARDCYEELGFESLQVSETWLIVFSFVVSTCSMIARQRGHNRPSILSGCSAARNMTATTSPYTSS